MVFVCASKSVLICASDDSTDGEDTDGDDAPTAEIGPDEVGIVVGVGDATG